MEVMQIKHNGEMGTLRKMHHYEMIDFRKSSEQEFMDKLAFLERSNPDRFIVHKEIRVPVMSIPVRFSDPVIRNHYGSMSRDSFVPVQRSEENPFEAKRMNVSYLDERMRPEVFKREIAKNIAEWIIKNDFIFGEFHHDRGVIHFGFNYYSKN